MTLPTKTDVLIVGAGPTGLTLACALAQAGISAVVLDRQATGTNTSRAAAVHARTLEVLEPLDVTRRMLEAGHVVPTFVIRDRDRVVARIRFERLPTPYPFVLMVPQSSTEAILSARLQELGGTLIRQTTVFAVDQREDGALVTVTNGDIGRRVIRAHFVVGADGMHSTVREKSGIAFEGSAYAQSFVLADVRLSWDLPRDEVMGYFSPEGLVIVAPLPGDRYRIVATVDDAPEFPTIEDVQRLLDERGPQLHPARVHDLVWSGRFHVHHRIAARYRAGRILLAGDAAHVHSPAGGQGMNTGIQDAVALSQALVTALTKGTDEALDAYEQRRRPVAQRVVAFTDRMTRIATLRGHRARTLRNTALGMASQIPLVPRTLATELAGLRYR